MNWALGIRMDSGRLYTGRRSLYIALTLGRTRYWLMRWDLARAPAGRFRTADGLSGWTWGRSRP